MSGAEIASLDAQEDLQVLNCEFEVKCRRITFSVIFVY